MKKIIALTLCLLLLLTCVQGVMAEAKEPVTITVWSNDAHSKGVFTDFVEKFNNGPGKELGIIIELSVYGTDYYSVLDVSLTGDAAPYIFKCNKIPQYASAGKLVALEDLPGGAELIAPYKEKNSEGVGLVDGKTYALPFKATTVGLAYNMELFEKLGLEFPKTWEEMEKVASTITENGNGMIYGYGLGMTYVSYPLFFILPPASASTGRMHFDNATGRYNFSALAPYMKHLLKIIDNGDMFPGYETMDDDTKRAQFAAGNIGMIPVFSPDVGVLTTQFPATFEWGVGPYPTETEDTRYRMYSNPSTFYVVNQRAVQDGVEEQVMAVMNALLSEENLLNLFEEEKDMITRDDVKAQSTKTEVSPQWKAFGDGSYRYTGFGTPDGKLQLEGDSYKDVFDKILTGLADVDAALADLDVRYNKALDEAVANGTLKIDDYIVENMDDIVKMD
ncbi:MAG: extracellular solute-binding protein [Clostridia bacterium]|nr:extracellular solute-binding protein [Clostridia bacterium]